MHSALFIPSHAQPIIHLYYKRVLLVVAPERVDPEPDPAALLEEFGLLDRVQPAGGSGLPPARVLPEGDVGDFHAGDVDGVDLQINSIDGKEFMENPSDRCMAPR